jgi:protein TonB
MKPKIIASLICALMLCAAVSAQQNNSPGVRTHCRINYSEPVKVVRPVYPALALQTSQQGRVSLKCIVGFDGSVENVKVTQGPPLLLKAAIDSVLKWKFRPPVLNGKAVKTEAIINIDFQLSNK